MIDGMPALITHSRLDIGRIGNLFDGDVRTLIRTADANPALLDIQFDQSRSVSAVGLDFGTMDVGLRIELRPVDSGDPEVFSQTFENLGPDPHVEMSFGDRAHLISGVRIEIRDLRAPQDQAKIHIRELSLR